MEWSDLMNQYETEEAVIEATKKASKIMLETGTYIDIRDDNCNDNCEGWDGDDDRCECRNRRVCWDWNFSKYTNRWHFYWTTW